MRRILEYNEFNGIRESIKNLLRIANKFPYNKDLEEYSSELMNNSEVKEILRSLIPIELEDEEAIETSEKVREEIIDAKKSYSIGTMIPKLDPIFNIIGVSLFGYLEPKYRKIEWESVD